jgi:uncharacterized protein YecE (DUF72 family)
VELNASFYHLVPRTTFERWADETPAAFRFSIKGNRFVTHNKKLKDSLAGVTLEKERAAGLGPKLAVVLWQTPPNLRKDAARLRDFAEALATDLVYLRLHGHEATYASPYATVQLREWAGRARRWLEEGREVHVYFDNDALGAAPRDARRLLEMLGGDRA